MLENHSYGEVIGNHAAPFLNALARGGALFTRSQAITHPSQPNYLALFSGSTQGVSGVPAGAAAGDRYEARQMAILDSERS
jgi:hypothetical protein